MLSKIAAEAEARMDAMVPPRERVVASVNIDSQRFESWRNPIRGEVTLSAKDAKRLAYELLEELGELRGG